MIVPLFVSSGKRCVAVLTPKEKNQILDRLNDEYRIRANFLLETHVRIAEAYYLNKHPECYRKANGAIFLPNVEEIGKVRCTIKNRAIILSRSGIAAVDKFFEKDEKTKKSVGLVTYQSMEEVFKRAARDADFDTKYITTKMFRKTMISWLMACFPERQSQVQHSAGHNYATMQGHYVTYGWRKDDIKDMRDETAGWGEV
jgi:integrase